MFSPFNIPGVRELPPKSRAPGTQKSKPQKKMHIKPDWDSLVKQAQRELAYAEAMLAQSRGDDDGTGEWHYHANDDAMLVDYAQKRKGREQERRDEGAKYRRGTTRMRDRRKYLGGGAQPYRGGRKRKSRKSRAKGRKSRSKRRTRKH